MSSALLKRMMNHAAAGDVTLGHYVAKSEAQLRAGWQAVADFVEEAARRSDAEFQFDQLQPVESRQPETA